MESCFGLCFAQRHSIAPSSAQPCAPESAILQVQCVHRERRICLQLPVASL